MKKKIGIFLISLVLLATLAFGLVGCTKKDKGQNSNKPVQITKKTLKIGVLHIGAEADKMGYTAAHENGIKDMIQTLKLDNKQVVRKWSVSDTDDSKINNSIQALIDEGCNVIIGTSFGYQNAMLNFANKYKNILFSHGTGYLHNDTNMNNYFGKIYQARYLAGMVAGLKAKDTGSNILGYVSAFGNSIAETVSGFNAFYLGAKAVNPDVTMKVDLLNSWYDPEKELTKAQNLIDAGARVISHHSDTVNVCKAAADKGAYSVGYNTDMRTVGGVGDSVLTSVVWNWSTYYTKLINAILDPNKGFKSIGQYYEGLAEGLLKITDFSNEVHNIRTSAYIEAVKNLINDKKWDVFSGKALKFTDPGYGPVEVEQVPMDFKGRRKEGEALETVIKSGEAVPYSVIQGTMDYVLEGIEGGFDKK